MKHKKMVIAVLTVMICLVMIGGISTVVAEENNAGILSFSSEDIETKGVFVTVGVKLQGNGDGTVSAIARNDFTLGNTILAVKVELYASVYFPMDYTEMQKVAWHETYDLNIFDTLSATSPTRGQQKYWCARVMYNKDGEGWKSDVTPIILLDANGNKVNT